MNYDTVSMLSTIVIKSSVYFNIKKIKRMVHNYNTEGK